MIVKELVAKITADTSDINRKMGKVDKRFERTRKLMKRVGVALAAAFTVGAIVKATRSIVEFANEIDRLQQIFGSSLEQTQKLVVWTKSLGVNMEDVLDVAQEFDVKIGDALNGSKETAKAFERVGLDPATVQQMDKLERTMTVVNALANAPENERASLANRLIGGGAAKNLAAVINSAERLEYLNRRLREESLDAGNGLDPEKLFKARVEFEILVAKAKAFGLELAGKILPYLEQAGDWISNNRDKLEQWVDVAKEIGKALYQAFQLAMKPLQAIAWLSDKISGAIFGGTVETTPQRGLPSYEEAQRQLERRRSRAASNLDTPAEALLGPRRQPFSMEAAANSAPMITNNYYVQGVTAEQLDRQARERQKSQLQGKRR